MKYRCLTLIYIATNCLLLQAEPSIIAFFRYEKNHKIMPAEVLQQKIEQPGKVARWGLKQLLVTPLSTLGIIGTYAGFCAVTNTIGQLTFPRKHATDTVTLLITPKIKPVIIRGQTVNHFIITPGAPYSWYELKREKDKKLSIPFWTVTKMDKNPTARIPAEAFIIFANPKDILLPESPIATLDGVSLLLPPFIVTKHYRVEPNALQFLKISKYFAPVRLSYRFLTERMATNV